MAMDTSKSHFPARPFVRLIPVRTAKRWGRWFVFAWLGIWLSAALLPCCEVAAAVALHSQAAHSGCEFPCDEAPDSGSGQAHSSCASINAPALASYETTSAPGGHFVEQVLGILASSYPVSRLPALSIPVAYRAAPPPISVYLRSQRLLI